MTDLEQRAPRILVVRCGAVGDTVMATCVLDPILRRWPDARIEWLATPGSAGLFAGDRRVSMVHQIKHRKPPVWMSPVKRRLVQSSQSEPFRLVLNLECADYFRRFVHALRADQLVGYGDGGLSWQDRHGVENHRAVLMAAGLAGKGAMPRLVGRAPDVELPDRYVVLHPGNSHSGNDRPNIRAWPEPRWRELCLRLREAGVPVVVTGTPVETALAGRVAGAEALNLAGKTDIPGMIGLLKRAAALVVSDTGPIHVAAAVGTPIIGLYGPTRPSQTAPYGRPGQVQLLRHHLDCSPCYGTPLTKQCRDNRCMQAITVDEVLQAVIGRWNGEQSPLPMDVFEQLSTEQPC